MPRVPGTENEPIDDSGDNRKLTPREAKKLMRDIKTIRGGGAGIPATWMWKELSEMTIAESTAMLEAMRSGRTWGEIQLDGIGGDNGQLRDHEYKQGYQY